VLLVFLEVVLQNQLLDAGAHFPLESVNFGLVDFIVQVSLGLAEDVVAGEHVPVPNFEKDGFGHAVQPFAARLGFPDFHVELESLLKLGIQRLLDCVGLLEFRVVESIDVRVTEPVVVSRRQIVALENKQFAHVVFRGVRKLLLVNPVHHQVGFVGSLLLVHDVHVVL